MSRLINNFDTYEIGDIVSFDPPPYVFNPEKRLTGKVVRVYNSRDLYHVEVDGFRYEVSLSDRIRRETSDPIDRS